MTRMIGIRFGDNDFTPVFLTFLRILDREGLDSYGTPPEGLTKSLIVELFNSTAYSLYQLVQHRGRDYPPVARDYLRISEVNVTIGQEVQDLLNGSHAQFNRDFYVLVQSPWDESRVYAL